MSTSTDKPLEAFVSFPSPYTQSLLVQALVSVLPSIKISLVSYPEESPAALQWADYDLLSFDPPHSNPTAYLISSYIYRKALIRKHQLHSTIQAYLAKCQHRGIQSILSPDQGGGTPRGWNVEIQFLDELDELLVDDLWDLSEGMRGNEDLPEEERSWYILKPGFADRAQGIRMFSTEDELRKAAELGFNGDEEDDRHINLDGDEEEDEDDGTGVMTSQLRHFVIQEYMPNPVLFDIAQQPNQPSPFLEGYKFHLRAYVLLTSAYTVHLSRTMLALFSGSPYTSPRSSKEGEELDLRPHLTNTCLQTDSFGAPAPPEELVKLFWELEGLDALSSTKDGKYQTRGKVTNQWLEAVFAKSGEVISEAIKAGAECGSFGLQFMPNAFEIFGVDLILSFPPASSTPDDVPVPKVTLLEFNASPDFHQSGLRLKRDLLEMFKGVIRISIAPFFGLETNDDDEKRDGRGCWEVGEERWGWRLVGKGEIRGSGW
uniref:Cytoplasmic protein n=1 Tax=Kwoniella bestiolae CBS 10118 TaxID=1296100 RepID=A0A1B9FV20_9TREE|nr:cytoplasmic protein [Kwoniella bestiolae CBS 10118]OCF22613.1 cytoplasmic protein [Kwoniella bestiolae CBS 10118]